MIETEQLELLPDAALLVSEDGRVTAVNALLEQLAGYPREALLGHAVERLVAEGLRQRHREHRAGFAAHERPRTEGLVVHLRHAEGHEVPVDVRLAPVGDGRVLALLHDVSERERVAASARHQARLLEAVGEAVIATDLQGRIEYWNSGAQRLYGWSSHEVLGRHILEVTPRRAAVPQGAELLRCLSRGEVWSSEMAVRDRSGRDFPVWATATPVLDEQGGLAGVIGVSTDISALRRAQEQAQRRAEQQEVVARLGQEVLDARDLDAVLQRVCEVVTEVLEVELSKVLELTADRERLLLRAGVGWRGDLVGAASVPSSEDSQAGYTLRRDEAVVIADVDEEDRFTIPEMLTSHGVRSGMSVAIPRRETTYGVLAAHSRQPRAFTSDDAAFLRNVAHVVGAAADRHAATVELERLALFDPLTGLANRALLSDRLAQALGRAAEHRRRVALLLIDLDEFKLVNDALGRAAGDTLLVEVARTLVATAPAHGSVARIADDAFAVLCEDLPGEQSVAETHALEAARRIHDHVTGHYELGGREVFVTARIGTALGLEGVDEHALLRHAEAAGNHAKQPGAGPITLYEPAVGSQAGERLTLINELQRAYAQDEFFLVYQPEIALTDGGLFGIEALLRWRHPARGVLAPDRFLETAESMGLLVPLGGRILQRACRQAARFPEGAPGYPSVSVNVSAHQLIDPGFVELVRGTLGDTGLEARRLILEITESAIIEDRERALATLRAVRDLGARIALDDFGTGFSSLTHLHQFPIDVLKIDKAFVQRLAEGGTADSIVATTITLARTLDLASVAEGVETREQLAYLTRRGCDIGQGYLWARPLPPDELGAWLRGHELQPGPPPA